MLLYGRERYALIHLNPEPWLTEMFNTEQDGAMI